MIDCGCVGRRERARRRFLQWVSRWHFFSVANNAFGKSAQGAFIKSTQGARAFGGAEWVFLNIQKGKGVGDENWTCNVFLFGDVSSEYTEDDDTAEIFEDGVSAGIDLLPLTSINTFGSTTHSFGTECEDVATPDGYTQLEFEKINAGRSTNLDTTNVSVTIRNISSVTLFEVTDANLCDTVELAFSIDWYFRQA